MLLSMLFARWELCQYQRKALTKVLKILQHSEVRGHSPSLHGPILSQNNLVIVSSPSLKSLLLSSNVYTHTSRARNYDRGQR